MLLTRSPLEYPRRGLSVRLACVKHAASVRPEPGSNSPQKISPIKDQPGFVKSPTKTGKKTNNQQKIILLIIHQKIMKKVKQKTVIIDALTRQHNNHPTPTHTMRVNIVCSHGIPHHNPHKSHGHETHTMFRINNLFPRHNIFTSKPHLPAKTVYTVIIT